MTDLPPAFPIEPVSLPASKSNYLARHWRGELSLPRSFWINTILLNSLLGFVQVIFAGRLTSFSATVIGSVVVILIYWGISLPLNVWQYVGIWRSVPGQIAQTGKQFWPYTARVFVGLFTCLSLVGLYRVVIPQIVTAVSMVSGDKEIGEFTLTVLPSGKEIEFKGGLKLGAASQLKRVLEAAPYVTTLRLETQGGRLGEALEMAAIVQKRNLIVYVPQMCASNGVILLLAGKERIIDKRASVGFHSNSFPGIKPAAANKPLADALKAVGSSSAFVKQATETPPNDLWIPPSELLLKEGVATRIATALEFGMGSNELSKFDFPTMRADLLQTPIYKALAAIRPKQFDRAVKELVLDLQGGSAFGAASQRVNSLLLTTAAECWPSATDKAVDGWVDLMITLISSNIDLAPRELLLKLNEGQAKGSVLTPQPDRSRTC